MKRANIIKEVKIVHLTVSAMLFIVGILLLAIPNIAVLAVRLMVSIGFCTVGCVRMLGYFSNDLYRLAFQYDLAEGALSVIIAILVMIYPQNLYTILPFAVGIFVLSDALLKLQTAFDAKVFGMRAWVGLLVSSALTGLGGIALLVSSVLITERQSLVGIGVVVAIDGAENFWNTMATVRIRAKKENRYSEELDAEEKPSSAD